MKLLFYFKKDNSQYHQILIISYLKEYGYIKDIIKIGKWFYKIKNKEENKKGKVGEFNWLLQKM